MILQLKMIIKNQLQDCVVSTMNKINVSCHYLKLNSIIAITMENLA